MRNTSMTLTLPRTLSGYRLGAKGRFHYFRSPSEVASMIRKFIEPRTEDVVVTITIERSKAEKANK